MAKKREHVKRLKLFSQQEIKYYGFSESNQECNNFIVYDNVVYLLNHGEPEPLIVIPDATKYTIAFEKFDSVSNTIDYRIIGYRRGRPIYTISYNHVHGITEQFELEELSKGYGGSHICKMHKKNLKDKSEKKIARIAVISKNGEIIFRTFGDDCYLAKIEDKPYYVVENNGNIEFYNIEGKQAQLK